MICVLLKTLSARVASNVLRTWAESNNSQPKSVLETDFDCGQTLHTGPVGCVGGWSSGEHQGLAIGSLWAGYGLNFSFNWKVWHENDSGEPLIYMRLSMVTSHPMLRPMTACNSKNIKITQSTHSQIWRVSFLFPCYQTQHIALTSVGNVLLNNVSSSHIKGEW